MADTGNGSTSASSNFAVEGNSTLQFQLSLLDPGNSQLNSSSGTVASTIPLFSPDVQGHPVGSSRPNSPESAAFPQYSLLAGLTKVLSSDLSISTEPDPAPAQRRIFQNTNVPFSTFICGSQGSGKSHTLSCMLENCLLQDARLGKSDPQKGKMAGMVLHYDAFSSGTSGQPCEAAYLCSSGIDVKILVSPSNLIGMKALYHNLPGLPPNSKKPQVLPFKLGDGQLNIRHMLCLMGADDSENTPLYMHVVSRILRDLATEGKFSYAEFKRRINVENFMPAQRSMLDMRLDLLEAFIEQGSKTPIPGPSQTKKKSKGKATSSETAKSPPSIWTFTPGSLTIVDLSCPFVDEASACVLFSIAVDVFLSENTGSRVLGLDEAHKFINASIASGELTRKLIHIIRLQRHLATRVIVSTQEPTISAALLDLATVTIVHRFASPAWLHVLKDHLAAGAGLSFSSSSSSDPDDYEQGVPLRHDKDGTRPRMLKQGWKNAVFEHISSLQVGEALAFAPTAAVSAHLPLSQHRETRSQAWSSTRRRNKATQQKSLQFVSGDGEEGESHDTGILTSNTLPLPDLLKGKILKVRIRSRLSADGGRSRMAV